MNFKKSFKLTLILVLTFLMTAFVSAQDITITGTITSSDDGAPLPGANIMVKGTTVGTITDLDGLYTISAPEDGVLVFSYVGYTTQEIEIGGSISIDVVLEPEIGRLEEVMVIGYGTVKKKDVTGSIVNVATEEMADRPVANVEQALQGMVAGVTVTNNGGSPAEPPTIRIRGNSTLNAEGPLWIVDGVINQNGVDPNEIESITVLKDASAAIYGTRASGGVILVETKKGSRGLEVDLNVKYGWKMPWRKLDVMNAAEYCDYYYQLYQDAGQPIPQVYRDSYFRTTHTTWLDEVFQTGATQDYSFSISGGSDKSTFALFANWKDIEGTLHNTYKKAGRIRLKSEHKVNKVLQIGENISITSSRSNGANTTSGYSGVVLGSVYYPPSAKVWATDPVTGIREYGGVIDQYDPNVDLNKTRLRLAGQAIMNRVYVFFKNMNGLEFLVFFPLLWFGGIFKIFEFSMPSAKKAIYFLPFGLFSMACMNGANPMQLH